METRPDLHHFDPAEAQPEHEIPGQGSRSASGAERVHGLRIIKGSALTLGHPASSQVPAGWASGIAQLAQWLDVDIAHGPQRPATGLRQVTAWARATRSAPPGSAAPMFVPWQGWSPIGLQPPATPGLPRAHWICSYLRDQSTGRQTKHTAVNVQLTSPLPMACSPEDNEDGSLPRPDVLQAMIEAARREGRRTIAIVTDARRRNAMIRQMLLLGRAALRDAPGLDIVTIEDALCQLVRHPAHWDAIIILPELRSLVFALLAEATGIKTPWPMVWSHRGIAMIASETLNAADGALPLNAPLLVETLELALRHADFTSAAQRLAKGAAQLRERGITTPGRGSVAPYVTEISDEEFIEHLCRSSVHGSRATASSRGSTAGAQPDTRKNRAHLRVVAST